MKYAVVVPALSALSDEAGTVAIWRKEIGDAVLVGETMAILRGAGGEAAVVAPVPGILTRKYAVAGEAVAVGEPLALLSGVPDSHVRVGETYSTPNTRYSILNTQHSILALTPQERELARHDARAAQTAPHLFTVVRADVSEAQRLAESVGISLTPFVLHSAAASLARFPRLNAAFLREGELSLHRKVNIAVLRSAPSGLAAPVVRDADKRSLLALARELADFAASADAGTLPPDAQRGATFTLSETPSGIFFQTALLRLPQVALLTFAPPDKADATENALLTLCLTHDARAATPCLAAAFLSDLKRGLEESAFLFSG